MKRAVCAALIAMMGAISPAFAELNTFKVYPNPFQTKQGHTQVRFEGITNGGSIKVFNVAGRLVFEKTVDASSPTFLWDVKNNDGTNIAGGMYLYFVESEGQEKKGKLGILR